MLEHVGQRLLHDAVCREVHAAGTCTPVRRVERHPEARLAASRLTRDGRSARPGTGCIGRPRPPDAEHPEHPAHLDQRIPARRLDRPERLPCARDVVVDDVRPTPACTAMTDIEWATTSCSSRAMRSRSAATAARSRSSRSRSSIRAAPRAPPSEAPLRRLSPASQATQAASSVEITSLGDHDARGLRGQCHHERGHRGAEATSDPRRVPCSVMPEEQHEDARARGRARSAGARTPRAAQATTSATHGARRCTAYGTVRSTPSTHAQRRPGRCPARTEHREGQGEQHEEDHRHDRVEDPRVDPRHPPARARVHTEQ